MRLKKRTHYSPSCINSFVQSPALYILQESGLYNFDGSPQTLRGEAVEYAVKLFLTGNKDINSIIDMTTKFWLSLDIDISHKDHIKEAESQNDFIRNAIKLYSKVTDTYLMSQKKIECPFPQVSLPFIGFVDFEFLNCVRDLKTTRAIPSKVPKTIQRQLSLYSFATGKQAWVDFVSPSKTVSYLIEDVENTIDEIIEIGKCLDNFYKLSDDPKELAKLFYPNFDDWRWDEELKNKSKLLWSIK